jgi:DNA polymerase
VDDDWLLITLPSGRSLRFARPRLEDTDRTIQFLDDYGMESEFCPPGQSLVYGEGQPTFLYGGKLAENIVQATARDLLVESVLAIESDGLPVVFHVHDEVVVEVPAEHADRALETVTNLMGRTPGWADGLPVACEGGVATCYGK